MRIPVANALRPGRSWARGRRVRVRTPNRASDYVRSVENNEIRYPELLDVFERSGVMRASTMRAIRERQARRARQLENAATAALLLGGTSLAYGYTQSLDDLSNYIATRREAGRRTAFQRGELRRARRDARILRDALAAQQDAQETLISLIEADTRAMRDQIYERRPDLGPPPLRMRRYIPPGRMQPEDVQ